MLKKLKALMCKALGHRMYFDTSDVGGPSTCRMCGRAEPAVEWARGCPPMPPKKCESCAEGFDGTKGDGYQPCGCKNA